MPKRNYIIPLSCPLPQSNWVQGNNGLWYSIPWTPRARAQALQGHSRRATEEEFDKWQRSLGL